MVLKVFACRNHIKYPPKYDLENERPQSRQKIDFYMIWGSVLGAKSIKKRIKIATEKTTETNIKKKREKSLRPRRV